MALTLSRILMIPAFIALYMTGFSLWALAVFIIASLTDALDGYAARKLGLESDLGSLLDPLADKILVVSALVLFVTGDLVPAWSVILILAREFSVTGLRSIAAAKGVVIAAGITGKLKTIFQMSAIILILFNMWLDNYIFGFSAIVIYWLAVVLTVASGIEYFVRNRAAYMGNGKENR